MRWVGKFAADGEWVTVVVTPVPEWCALVPRNGAKIKPGHWWASRVGGGWVARLWM